MTNDDRIREAAKHEKAGFTLPEAVHQSVEETLRSLPDHPQEEVSMSNINKRTARARWISGVAAAILAIFICLPNVNATTARALSGIPVLGPVFRVVTFREFSETSGDESVDIKVPSVETDNGAEGAKEVSREVDALTQKVLDEFYQETDRMTDGGKRSLDVDYEVLNLSDKYFTLKVTWTETGADTGTMERYYNLDRKTGKRVELSDLFKDDRYIAVLSDYVKEEMRAQIKADDSVIYFVDTDLPDEDFQEIDPDQDFFFDADGRLNLCFAQYTVAPGFMGTVTFAIPDSVTQGLRK